jgi:hypothetical protein
MNTCHVITRVTELIRIRTAAVGLIVAASLAPSCVVAATAQLSDWTGQGNFDGENDYKFIPPDSVGGTFQSRMSPPPPSGTFPETWYFRDASLTGGPLGFDDALSMSGTITLSSPNHADPSWFFGWYKSDDYRYRLGFSAAQAVLDPPNAIRMSIARGNGGAASTPLALTSDGGSSSLKATIPDGTYAFSFSYTPGASNNLSVHITSPGTDWRRENQTVNWSTPDVFDRFGFLQIGTTVDTRTFDVIVSDLSYTGESVPEPPASTLATICAIAAIGRLSSSRAGRIRPPFAGAPRQ